MLTLKKFAYFLKKIESSSLITVRECLNPTSWKSGCLLPIPQNEKELRIRTIAAKLVNENGHMLAQKVLVDFRVIDSEKNSYFVHELDLNQCKF